MEIKKKFLTYSSLVFLSVFSLQSCGPLDNPFLPRATLDVTNITSANVQLGVSISQTFKSANDLNVAQYAFNEPSVTIANRQGLPRVLFKQIIVQFTIDDKKLPPQIIPTALTIPTGGVFIGTIPILSSSKDLLNVVYPNHSFSNVSFGLADVSLVGIDDNNNVVGVKFSSPVRFLTDPSGFKSPVTRDNENPRTGNLNEALNDTVRNSV